MSDYQKESIQNNQSLSTESRNRVLWLNGILNKLSQLINLPSRSKLISMRNGEIAELTEPQKSKIILSSECSKSKEYSVAVDMILRVPGWKDIPIRLMTDAPYSQTLMALSDSNVTMDIVSIGPATTCLNGAKNISKDSDSISKPGKYFGRSDRLREWEQRSMKEWKQQHIKKGKSTLLTKLTEQLSTD